MRPMVNFLLTFVEKLVHDSGVGLALLHDLTNQNPFTLCCPDLPRNNIRDCRQSPLLLANF